MTRAAPTVLILALLAAGPAAAAAHWSLTVDGDGAHLVAAAGEESDEGVTSLSCAGGEKKATVYVFVDHREAARLAGDTWVNKAGKRAPWKILVTVTSGAVSGSFPGEANADEESGGSSVEVVVPTTSPVMRAFAASGKLTFTAFGERSKDPPVPMAKAARFVKVCG